MQQAVQRALDPNPEPIIEAASRAHSVPVNLGVEWGSRGEEFRTSLRDFFAGPRPTKISDGSRSESLKIDFVEQRLPLRGLLASCLWHVGAIWLLILPIWGFLPKIQPTLQAPQIELTWYTTPEDLPKILLPSTSVKSKLAAHKREVAVKPSPAPAEEAYHPRQTILSVPMRATHPRQTLIQPKATPEPPKMAPDLPNMVQWTASEPPKLRLQLAASKAAPQMARHKIDNAAAPEISGGKENGARLDLLSDQTPKKLAMPLSASTATAVNKRTTSQKPTAAAPDINNSGSDGNVRQLIALSATPALAAPKVNVPQGNLAARIAMSPEGRKSGVSGGSASAKESLAKESPLKGGSTLPAAISISEGNPRAKGGEIHSPGKFRRDLGLTPFSRTDADSLRRAGPARINVDNISKSLPPETVFSGRQVYTLDINMPNVTSASGSWILNFAELDTGDDSPVRHRETLAGPVPEIKVDPKYPPDSGARAGRGGALRHNSQERFGR
jgi:hypothetical protein